MEREHHMLTWFGRAALALVLAVPFAGATVGGAQTLQKITLVQMHPIMGVGEEVFLYAVPKHLGYFAAEGIDVDIQNTQTGMVSAQLLQSGNAQVGTTAGDAVLSVRERGGDLISFFNLKRNPGTVLVVLPHSPIHGLADLKGKTIGAPSFGAGGGLALKENLTEIGITPDQYTGIATGAGPAAIAALRSGKIDALVLWDAMLAAAENTGMTLRIVHIPLQDEMVGTTLATSAKFAAAHPNEVAGYCRAMTKGLVFTMTNRAAAVRILWDEFPNVKPTGLDDATALANGVHVMDRWLEMALQGQPANAPLGGFIPANWDNTRVAFMKLGTLKGTESATAAYTSKFLAGCNDFDRSTIVTQAKDWKS
jgi:NitT/TauT family transport system substrate-binding protein